MAISIKKPSFFFHCQLGESSTNYETEICLWRVNTTYEHYMTHLWYCISNWSLLLNLHSLCWGWWWLHPLPLSIFLLLRLLYLHPFPPLSMLEVWEKVMPVLRMMIVREVEVLSKPTYAWLYFMRRGTLLMLWWYFMCQALWLMFW